MRRLALLVVGVIGLAGSARAGLIVKDLNDGVSTNDMANKLVGQGVTVSNVRYTGAANASGIFCSGGGIIGFGSGILLTSGDAANVIGPNNSSGATGDNELPGDPDLTGLIGGAASNQTYDASVLEFDFVPEADTVQFSYVFGSEEYNEYVGSEFNDVFAFFVNGVNYALIPGTATPVSINNVNNGFSTGISAGPCENCAYYIDNVDGHLNTQLDGLTVVLTFTAPVLANQVNHMKIAIADAGDHLLDSAVLLQAGSLRSGASTNNPTRPARFWFTHHESSDPECATLRRAIDANCGGLDLGFVDLPNGYRNNDDVKDSEDAMMEALGFYWKSHTVTGEIGGTQSARSRASSLCEKRKNLAVQLIAAIANVQLLGAVPSQSSYVNAHTNVFFATDLIDQARAAAAGQDRAAIASMTALLRLFNKSGQTYNYPSGVVECSPTRTSRLKALARDPTTQASCPGINNSCEAAEVVYFPNTGSFSSAVFKRTINLNTYTNAIASPSCGTGGNDAIWQVPPSIGVTNRSFTVNTDGSNFDTMISVWDGTCGSLTEVACTNAVFGVGGERLTFTTDGVNTFYIVVEGPSGGYGRLNVKITSP
ncbi:MAG TPA: choice-of-anchor L domain-containing protein [Verrucomicrobiae bacterium]|nr:choice-of-anchor L domain-containing protein [Verrucomicrobiae bacterium]